MLNVTKTYLPPLDQYVHYLEGIWQRCVVTNNGPLVLELESALANYFDIPFVQFVSNGTIAIQLAIQALGITKEVITTPFSYVATTSSILWERCKPVFVDIETDTFCIDANLIEKSITEDTEAILATHVYGYPCDAERIEQLAQKHDLKVIYDAAHAFGTKFKGRSVLHYGDLSTLSFHATKLFHTIEGGAIAGKTMDLSEKIWLLKSFGHKYDDYFCLGINGKNTEFHAAMGLCLLPNVLDFIARRRAICLLYDELLKDCPLKYPKTNETVEYNYSYYPVIFSAAQDLLAVQSALAEKQINTRRYFYPSLNRLPYVNKISCPNSESIAERVLCLPLFVELTDEQVAQICAIVRGVLISQVGSC
jgi:dTDP-4-amino-4,6-dideoxygalactose transaminase